MPNETTEPEWTDAEHDEIMRLHIVDGLTISEAKQLLFEIRTLDRVAQEALQRG